MSLELVKKELERRQLELSNKPREYDHIIDHLVEENREAIEYINTLINAKTTTRRRY